MKCQLEHIIKPNELDFDFIVNYDNSYEKMNLQAQKEFIYSNVFNDDNIQCNRCKFLGFNIEIYYE